MTYNDKKKGSLRGKTKLLVRLSLSVGVHKRVFNRIETTYLQQFICGYYKKSSTEVLNMAEEKLLFGTACISVGIITMLLIRFFERTIGELLIGAFFIVVGLAFLGVWLVDRVRKKSSKLF